MAKKSNKDIITMTRVNTQAVTRIAATTDDLYQGGEKIDIETTTMWFDEMTDEVCVRTGNGNITAFELRDFTHLANSVISHGYWSLNERKDELRRR